MPLTLSTRYPEFEAGFLRLLAAKRETAADVDVTLTAHATCHRIELQASSPVGEQWLAQIES